MWRCTDKLKKNKNNTRTNGKRSVIIRLANTLRWSENWFIIYNFILWFCSKEKSKSVWRFMCMIFFCFQSSQAECVCVEKQSCTISNKKPLRVYSVFIHHNQTLLACSIRTECFIIKCSIYPHTYNNK